MEELVAEVLSAEIKDGAADTGAPGANLGAFGDEELRSLAESLLAAETSVSSRRRTLHDQIDHLQSAIVTATRSEQRTPTACSSEDVG